jgi:hypothetical protein
MYTLKGERIMETAVLSDETSVLLSEEKSLSDREEECRMSYIDFAIHEFAEAFKMSTPDGYRYLEEFGGLDFICEHWWALHIDNQDHVMDEIFDVCKRNGGYL